MKNPLVPIVCLTGMIFSPIIPEIGEKVTGFFAGVLFYYSINALLKE